MAFAWSGDIQGLAADNPDLALDRAQGRRDAVLRQHDDPEDLRPAGPGDGLDQLRATIPAHSAQIVAAAPYISAVKGAGEELAKIAPDLAKSSLVNPPDDLRARLHVFRALSDAEDTEFNQIFQDAIGA